MPLNVPGKHCIVELPADDRRLVDNQDVHVALVWGGIRGIAKGDADEIQTLVLEVKSTAKKRDVRRIGPCLEIGGSIDRREARGEELGRVRGDRGLVLGVRGARTPSGPGKSSAQCLVPSLLIADVERHVEQRGTYLFFLPLRSAISRCPKIRRTG